MRALLSLAEGDHLGGQQCARCARTRSHRARLAQFGADQPDEQTAVQRTSFAALVFATTEELMRIDDEMTRELEVRLEAG